MQVIIMHQMILKKYIAFLFDCEKPRDGYLLKAKHFSDSHVNDYTAWHNVEKSDKLYLKSVRHPRLKDATAR